MVERTKWMRWDEERLNDTTGSAGLKRVLKLCPEEVCTGGDE